MSRLLFHITTGPENPTKITLGLIVARAARTAGHEVDVFFAGDGIDVVRPETRALIEGVGTGSAADHWDALVAAGARLYGSAMSAAARGVSSDGPLQLVQPERLVELIDEADKVVVY